MSPRHRRRPQSAPWRLSLLLLTPWRLSLLLLLTPWRLSLLLLQIPSQPRLRMTHLELLLLRAMHAHCLQRKLVGLAQQLALGARVCQSLACAHDTCRGERGGGGLCMLAACLRACAYAHMRDMCACTCVCVRVRVCV